MNGGYLPATSTMRRQAQLAAFQISEAGITDDTYEMARLGSVAMLGAGIKQVCLIVDGAVIKTGLVQKGGVIYGLISGPASATTVQVRPRAPLGAPIAPRASRRSSCRVHTSMRRVAIPLEPAAFRARRTGGQRPEERAGERDRGGVRRLASDREERPRVSLPHRLSVRQQDQQECAAGAVHREALRHMVLLLDVPAGT